MPQITFDLTDQQALKLLVRCGWKVHDLSGEAKRIVLDAISTPAKASTPPKDGRPAEPTAHEILTPAAHQFFDGTESQGGR